MGWSQSPLWGSSEKLSSACTTTYSIVKQHQISLQVPLNWLSGLPVFLHQTTHSHGARQPEPSASFAFCFVLQFSSKQVIWGWGHRNAPGPAASLNTGIIKDSFTRSIPMGWMLTRAGLQPWSRTDLWTSSEPGTVSNSIYTERILNLWLMLPFTQYFIAAGQWVWTSQFLFLLVISFTFLLSWASVRLSSMNIIPINRKPVFAEMPLIFLGGFI